MTKRLWFTTTTGRADGTAGVEALTDEQALARIERGEDIRPVQGKQALIDTIKEEVSA